jgi:hypothetical protein
MRILILGERRKRESTVMSNSDTRPAVKGNRSSIPGRSAVAGPSGGWIWPVLIRFLCALLLITGSAYSFKMPFFQKKAAEERTDVFDWFFNEAYAHNGFNYSYPASSSVSVIRGNAHTGKYALQFDLDPNDYSGGSICLNEQVYNLKPLYHKGALQFWVKGAKGNEKAWVALVDEEKSDGHKTVVRLEIGWFGPVTTEWTLISIPLEKFGERGAYWDDKEQREVDNVFDWEQVAEFRIEVKKGDNSEFRLWVDDIVIMKSLR